MPESFVVQRETHIAAPRASVFAFLTDPDKIVQWMGTEATTEMQPGGLYLLDEPEAPLSPQSQLGLMAMIAEMVAEDAQFVIATHSPLLLAYPGARIVSFDEVPVRQVAYDELESVRLVREFLAAPERYLRGIVPDR